ncbi:MAG: hypothetical protein CMH06_06000 [Marinovum sp.]|nr:hypothetical protein [Marinovum sp.]
MLLFAKNYRCFIVKFGYFFIFLKKMVELSGNIGWCATRLLLCRLAGLSGIYASPIFLSMGENDE